MRTVWKFDLEATDLQSVEMPKDASLLHVGAQDPTGSTVQLWAEVDPSEPKELRYFAIEGTGHPLPHNPGLYLGTVVTAGGALVWHVYEASNG